MISYEGKLCRIRPLKADDIQRTIHWRNDPAVRDLSLGYRFPVTQKMEERWLETAMDDQSRTRVNFAIEENTTGDLVGLIHLNEIDWIARRSYFGIVIGEKQYQGRGIGKESMILLFRFAFNYLNLRKICLEVASFNTAGIGLYQKFGFAHEGLLMEHFFLDGKYHDLVLMSIFVDRFRELHDA